MIKVGVTGNMGSGKSTVCRIFQCLGVPVISADEVGRDLLETDPSVRSEVTQLLGPESYGSMGPDRRWIASRVFGDETRLAALNAIIHPRVRFRVEEWFVGLPAGTVLAIEESALLIETGGYRDLDRMILVTAPVRVRMDRIRRRDGLSTKEVTARMARQWPEARKRRFCDDIIRNDSRSLLIPQVMEIFRKIVAGCSDPHRKP